MKRFRSSRFVLGAAAGAAVLAAIALLVSPPRLARAQEPAEEPASDAYLIAKGRVTFRIYCANCHGEDGRGDGPLAEILKVKPADLTVLARDNGGLFPRADVHAKIDGRNRVKAHGSREMPVWGDAFQKTLQPTWKEVTDEERAQLKIVEVVYFVESIQQRDDG